MKKTAATTETSREWEWDWDWELFHELGKQWQQEREEAHAQWLASLTDDQRAIYALYTQYQSTLNRVDALVTNAKNRWDGRVSRPRINFAKIRKEINAALDEAEQIYTKAKS